MVEVEDAGEAMGGRVDEEVAGAEVAVDDGGADGGDAGVREEGLHVAGDTIPGRREHAGEEVMPDAGVEISPFGEEIGGVRGSVGEGFGDRYCVESAEEVDGLGDECVKGVCVQGGDGVTLERLAGDAGVAGEGAADFVGGGANVARVGDGEGEPVLKDAQEVGDGREAGGAGRETGEAEDEIAFVGGGEEEVVVLAAVGDEGGVADDDVGADFENAVEVAREEGRGGRHGVSVWRPYPQGGRATDAAAERGGG